MTGDRTQVWRLTVGGVEHRVVGRGGVRHLVQWYADGALVAQKGTAEGRFRLRSEEHGTLEVRYGGLGRPRRATLGGLDLVPEPGSPAAELEDRVRARPHLYAVVQTAGGVARVVVPILLTLVTVRLALSLPLPDLPLPDLPRIPTPDLPAVPLPAVTLPAWLRWVLENAHYVVPVVVAFVLAQAEIRRRRRQDALRDRRS